MKSRKQKSKKVEKFHGISLNKKLYSSKVEQYSYSYIVEKQNNRKVEKQRSRKFKKLKH